MHISGKYLDAGLLILRTGLGILFVLQGYPTFFGGPEMWEEYGQMFLFSGAESVLVFFGFFAAMVELFGGLFLILGLYMKPILILFAFVLIATTFNIAGQGAPFAQYAQPLRMTIVFLSLLMLGPGKHSIDYRIKKRSSWTSQL